MKCLHCSEVCAFQQAGTNTRMGTTEMMAILFVPLALGSHTDQLLPLVTLLAVE